MSQDDGMLHCRHCSYTCKKWRVGKDGRTRSGWRLLENHLEDEHGILVNLSFHHDDEEATP